MNFEYKSEIVNGNEAFAYGAIDAGLEIFSGYPITPSTDVLELLAKELEKYGGVFFEAESELSAINMLMGAGAVGAKCLTATSGPGFSLMQETISYMAADYIPAVILNVSREGAGLGDIPRSQGDYNQMVHGGGNGDYHSIVLTCNSIKSCFEIPKHAFHLASKYRLPVIVTYDSDIGHLKENIQLPIKFRNITHEDFDWSIASSKSIGIKKKIQNRYYHNDDFEREYLEKYKTIEKNEQMFENFIVDDAEVIFVAYGICSRVCKDAVLRCREKGKKVGLINPITLYPYPESAFSGLKNLKKVVVCELTVMEQMTTDVKIIINEKYGKDVVVKKVGRMSTVIEIDDLLNEV